MLRLATVLGLCVVLSGCASTPPALNLAAFNPRLLVQTPVAHLPLINAGNRQWRVRIVVNGQAGVFAVDTGSEATIISPQFAQQVGLLSNAIPGRFAGPNPVRQQVHFAKITYLQLDGILYLNFYAPILNLDHINQAMLTPIDGILGNNVLRKTAATIDWRNNVLTLDTQSPPKPTGAISVTVRENRIFLNALINGRSSELALDTGAYCSSLTTNEVSRLEIPASKRSQIATRRIDIAESNWAVQTEVTLDSFQLGAITRENFPMLTWDHSVVGMDLLDSWILSFDERAGWLALTPY